MTVLIKIDDFHRVYQIRISLETKQTKLKEAETMICTN